MNVVTLIGTVIGIESDRSAAYDSTCFEIGVPSHEQLQSVVVEVGSVEADVLQRCLDEGTEVAMDGRLEARPRVDAPSGTETIVVVEHALPFPQVMSERSQTRPSMA